MKRIYFSILVTALISLFLLGKFIDLLFDSNDENIPRSEFVTERHLANGIRNALSQHAESDLQAQVEHYSRQFQINLSLEKKSNLSLSTELEKSVNSKEGLLIDLDPGVQLIGGIENHPEWLISYPIEHEQPIDNDARFEVWLTILFYSGFCIILLLWALPLTRRLSKLNRLASDFGEGDLSSRAVVSRFSYIKELEVSFNRMASQIEELLAENKLLAGSLSHDLRSPLSCLRFGVDAALETGEATKKDYYLERMDGDLTRMETMLEAFLDYASLERKRFQLTKRSTDIVMMINSVVNACYPLLQNANVQVETNFDFESDKLMVELDTNWIARALSNLITNAIYHGNNIIFVNCEVNARGVDISVEDDGAGIPESEIENIFKAFVKLDKSRTKSNRYGLGLAIVARVVGWHNGEISVSKSDKLGGACFTIRLPH
ncbi:sensor histidine kinase [Aliikangiella coralliicola]|uniref:histidine kinase n=1 Tax=Aliikangiella coralliicola TaxID=2592383 RepID=A0A545UEK3_9GAMM|nr:ATP-binding protein [Aliikangiella coralliicola]TQV87910.1 two-component sensor histidine kinase [Aliikangiella coralliicola]